jgi:hypothetical protein
MKWVSVVLIISMMVALMAVCRYQADVIEQQRHTIRQLMGLELGPHATPRPKDELPLSSAPNPETRSI